MPTSLTTSECSTCIEPAMPWEFRTRNGFRRPTCAVCRARADIQHHQKAIARLEAEILRVRADRARRQELARRARAVGGD
jgi:hypothetical protein